MAPKAAEDEAEPGEAKPPENPEEKFRFKFKSLHLRTKNLFVATFAFICFCIFVAAAVACVQLAWRKMNPLEESLKKVRSTLAEAQGKRQLNYAPYSQIATAATHLPKLLSDSAKDYAEKKETYKYIFRNGKLPAPKRPEEWDTFGRRQDYISQEENLV